MSVEAKCSVGQDVDEERRRLKTWRDWIRQEIIRASLELGKGAPGALYLQKDNKMTVFVLIREDQNKLGYIDTSITGVFRDGRVAKEMETLERRHARQQGLVVEDDESPDGEWQVSWTVEEHLLD